MTVGDIFRLGIKILSNNIMHILLSRSLRLHFAGSRFLYISIKTFYNLPNIIKAN
jgi:hypothetical protein